MLLLDRSSLISTASLRILYISLPWASIPNYTSGPRDRHARYKAQHDARHGQAICKPVHSPSSSVNALVRRTLSATPIGFLLDSPDFE